MLFPTIERDLMGKPSCTLRLTHVHGRFQGLLFFDDPASHPELSTLWSIKRTTQGISIAETLEKFETNYVDCVAPMGSHSLDRELGELMESWLIAGYDITIAQWSANLFTAWPHEPLFNPYDWRGYLLLSTDRGATVEAAIANRFRSMRLPE